MDWGLYYFGMNKLKIEDPDNFEFASVVIKESKSGFSSNRRLLVVRGGHLYYFSNIPQFFKGNPKDLEYHHQLPKHSINLTSVKRIRPFQATSCTFQIVFDEGNLLEREDIRKTLIDNLSFVPKSKGEQVYWRFTCDNNVIKHKWVTFLTQLREHFKKENQEINNYFQSIHQTQLSSSSNASKQGKTPWRDSTVLRKQYSVSDFKSVIDLPQPLSDTSTDRGFKKSKQDFRLTNTYTHQIQADPFQLQEQELHMSQPGKELKMKKPSTAKNVGSKMV